MSVSELTTATYSDDALLEGRVQLDAELAARRSLRGQIARLDQELSDLQLGGFPHVRVGGGEASVRSAPRLASLATLEAQRDALVRRLRDAEAATAAHVEHERAARALLAAMQLEPGRYKFVRLRAADVGEAGCGVWHVRPRLGIIGMLAGWWQVKLSSGCPLAKAAAIARRPSSDRSQTRPASTGRRIRVARAAISMATSSRR
jgi:hypothetical protein